jgi:hypothetical protein
MREAGPKNWDQAPPAGPRGGWVWRDAAGALKSPFLLFLPDGRVGGSAAAHLAGWRPALGGGLVLADLDGNEVTLTSGANGFHGGAHSLIHIRDWPIRALGPRRLGRRNLVVLRGGDGSLHPLWLESMNGHERNWDLCLSYYGDRPEQWRDQAEYFVAQKGTKFGGLDKLVGAPGFLWDYDYIWFPDDDLLIDGADINLMFALARRFDLLLAQPSLALGCFVNHRITEQQRDCRLRFTSFVEIMAPLFAREALAVVAPSFGLNQSGYGLDHLWPALLGAPLNRIAVIDEVAMVHTRPMGANYDAEGASSEGWDVLGQFGLCQLYATYGGVTRQARGWSRVRGETGKMLEGM